MALSDTDIPKIGPIFSPIPIKSESGKARLRDGSSRLSRGEVLLSCGVGCAESIFFPPQTADGRADNRKRKSAIVKNWTFTIANSSECGQQRGRRSRVCV